MILRENQAKVNNNSTLRLITPIYVTHRGRSICVGRVVGATFEKHVQASRHFLRTPRAICLDAACMADIERAGAVTVAITDDETGATYTCTLDTFKLKNLAIDRGDGQQLCLTLGYWRRNGQASEIERQTEQAAKPAMTQLSMFGGGR